MMNDEIRKKWETLLASLTVPRRSDVICSEAELERAEGELGFKFPVGYKEFCSVFGSGSLGQGDAPAFFRIYCPCCPRSSFDIRQTGGDLIGLKLDVEANEPIADEEKAKTLYRLLESGYPFADSDRADTFIWDITTFRKEDGSYDIYWIPDEEALKVTLIGRDFFEFVEEFCLGAKWKNIFPEEYVAHTAKTQKRFFIAFVQQDESRSPDLSHELVFQRAFDDLLRDPFSIEGTEVALTCGYHAPGKEQAECLQGSWGREGGADLEIISASDRPNLPRLVEVTVTVNKGQITREYTEGLLRKMIKIGEECNSRLTSVGSHWDTNEN